MLQILRIQQRSHLASMSGIRVIWVLIRNSHSQSTTLLACSQRQQTGAQNRIIPNKDAKRRAVL
jgi:hypothetical protein